jgi:S-disulfanyl-L-cysteine oxidoreductase SoxD
LEPAIPEFRIALFAAFALACAVPAHAQSPYGIRRAAASAEIAGWNIDVDRYGNNLPPGSGTVNRGHDVFDQQCAACHGTKGEGGIGDQLMGGQGTLATPKPVRTVGSTGRMRRRCSITSVAPCRRTRRNR